MGSAATPDSWRQRTSPVHGAAANGCRAPSGVTRRQRALAGLGLWSRAQRPFDPGAGRYDLRIGALSGGTAPLQAWLLKCRFLCLLQLRYLGDQHAPPGWSPPFKHWRYRALSIRTSLLSSALNVGSSVVRGMAGAGLEAAATLHDPAIFLDCRN